MAKKIYSTSLVHDICNAVSSTQSHIESYLRKHNYSDIKEFQKKVLDYLKNHVPAYVWEIEHPWISGYSDRIDVFGENENEVCIIEIDASRADQVAKKMLSRFALWQMSGCKKKLSYVAILYPQISSSRNECEKYIEFGNTLLKKLNKDSTVVAVFFDESLTKWQVWDPNVKSTFSITCGAKTISVAGLTACAKTVISEYLKANAGISFPQLKKVFNMSNTKYVDTEVGASRYSNLTTLADGTDVYVYTQWREYGYRSNWDKFVGLCKKLGYVISKTYLLI